MPITPQMKHWQLIKHLDSQLEDLKRATPFGMADAAKALIETACAILRHHTNEINRLNRIIADNGPIL